jgi:hypothetical protein
MKFRRMLIILVFPELVAALSACSTGQPSLASVPSATLAQPMDTPLVGQTVSPIAPTQTVEAQPGEITRSGLISRDEVWSGIVHITGDVIVEAGYTITIAPGTVVYFASHQDDTGGSLELGWSCEPDGWILSNNDPTCSLEYDRSHIKLDVYGTLIARGTPEDWITFTSDSPNPDGGDWMHMDVNVNSQIEYAIIEYSRGGLNIAENTGTSVLVSHNIMRHNLWTGLAIHSSSPTVTYNEIYDSGGHQAIDVLGEGSAPLIAYNTLRDNKGGINITPGTSPTVEYNTLIDNDSGIGTMDVVSAIIRGNIISVPNGAHDGFSYMHQVVYPTHAQIGEYSEITCIFITNSSPLVVDNQITQCPKGFDIKGDSSPEIRGNTIAESINAGLIFDESYSGSAIILENNIYHHSCSVCSMSTHPIDVSQNWWGTTNAEDIAGTVRSQGPINFQPFLEQPVELP